MDTHNTMNQEGARRTYVVVLQADDGRRVRYYTCAASAERAQELACAAELAPAGAVVSVRVSEFEEGGR
jgi:hypothetical protein